jgi:hypothetical protein
MHETHHSAQIAALSASGVFWRVMQPQRPPAQPNILYILYIMPDQWRGMDLGIVLL